MRKSLEHLKSIELLETDQNVSGLLWPVFITGCEADDDNLRRRTVATFEWRAMYELGILLLHGKLLMRPGIGGIVLLMERMCFGMMLWRS